MKFKLFVVKLKVIIFIFCFLLKIVLIFKLIIKNLKKFDG